MKSTTTYLHFDGNCRAAMAFYRECFGGELEVMAYPDASGKPSSQADALIQHSVITQSGQAVIMASDYPPNAGNPIQGTNFSVFIDCSSNSEVERLFTMLSGGGKVTVPPSDMPFGRFAMCEDAFGISWILNSAGGAAV